MQERIIFEDNRLVPILYGEQNLHLRKIEEALNVSISSRGNELVISGESANIESARQVLEALWSKIQQNQEVDLQTVNSALRFMNDDQNGAAMKNSSNDDSDKLKHFTDAGSMIVTKKRKIQPRSPMQSDYIAAMQENELVFGIGPAGTGKTYLAVAMAVAQLEAGAVERIILCRPAVEAGERIGFLPGEMKEKMDPYMRPLYDALHDTMYADKLQKKLATEEIEIAPLAFMRGRTLSNAFIILDEAQNATSMQMLMFLTRCGENSQMIITGDPSQTDLPSGSKSGLVEAVDILKGTKGIEDIIFTQKDVVRSNLVARIINAYDKKKGK